MSSTHSPTFGHQSLTSIPLFPRFRKPTCIGKSLDSIPRASPLTFFLRKGETRLYMWYGCTPLGTPRSAFQPYDVGFQMGDACESPATYSLARQLPKPALHEIEPAGAWRRHSSLALLVRDGAFIHAGLVGNLPLMQSQIDPAFPQVIA